MNAITRLSSDVFFGQNGDLAKQAADSGSPVVVIDHDRPAYVFLSHDVYRRMFGPSLREMVEQVEGADFDFEPPRLQDSILRPID